MYQSKGISIDKAEVRLLKLPLVTKFATGFGVIDYKETVLVKITDKDGVIGWGEAAALSFPNYSPETSLTTFLGLKEYLLPLIVNQEFNSQLEAANELEKVKGFHFAKTAIDCALWMITSIKENQSISKLLGGNKTKISVGESIGIKDSISETLEEITTRIDQGYQRIKVKIKPGWDLDVMKEIRKKLPDTSLMVDANSSYTLKDVKTFTKLDEYDLLMIEQPLGDDDIVDHSILQKKIKTSVCLDESILSVEDARKAIDLGACKIINIKPGRVGGISEGKKIHDLCQDKNIGVWCGGLLETGIGRAFNISLSSLPGFIYPADMSPFNFFYKEDLVKNPFSVDKNGEVEVPSVPGLGFEIDITKINKYTISKLAF